MDIKLKNNSKRIERLYIGIFIVIVSLIITLNALLSQSARVNQRDNGARYFTSKQFYFELFGDIENIYAQYIDKINFDARNTIAKYNKATSLFEESKLKYNRENLYDRPSSNINYMILNKKSGKWGGSLTSKQRELINIKNYDKIYSLESYINILEEEMSYLWHIEVDAQGVLDTVYTSSGIKYSNDMYRKFCEEYQVEPLKNIEVIYMIPKQWVVQDDLYRNIEQYKYYGYQDPILFLGIVGGLLSMLLGLTYPSKYIDSKGIIQKYMNMPFEFKLVVATLLIVCFKVYMNLSIGIGSGTLSIELSEKSTVHYINVERMLIIGNTMTLYSFYLGIYINSRYIKNVFKLGIQKGILNNIWVIYNRKKIQERIKKPYKFISTKALGIVGISFNLLVIVSVSFFGVWGILIGVVYSIIVGMILNKYLKDIQGTFNKLQVFTYELEKGNLDVQIESDLGIFNILGESLSKVKGGFKQAVEQEVKSERMKTELISNVSHDLKTPLTSIISYVDLLKMPNLEEETRKEYIQILESKSRRLQALIEDLFEVSKVVSGNINLELQEIDIVALMNQIIGELKDKIDKSGLEFKVNFPQQKVLVSLDGRAMVRVIENLIGNCIKYAMISSRVFIDIREDREEVCLIMKNTSAQEMKFTAEEIVERFKRGDTARHTEGAGLGLAISKSLTELQGGSFDIVLDGDLFKVVIKFKK